MVKYPKIGEYWYVRPLDGDMLLCKCVGIFGSYSVMEYTYFDKEPRKHKKVFSKHINSSNACKWEPNWFQKLLGYI